MSAVVVSVSMLGAGSDPAGYYLSRQAICPAEYYLGAEPAGRWLGSGAEAAGFSGSVDAAGAAALRGLLAGRGPDGEVLVAEVIRVDRRGRLPARPLVDAIAARATAHSVTAAALFGQPRERALFAALETRVASSGRTRHATVSPERAGQLATAVGLDVRDVYRAPDGADRYAAAVRFADRRVDVRRPGVDVTISAPKSVSVLFGLGDQDTSSAVVKVWSRSREWVRRCRSPGR